jgi:hypothetical protein
MPFEEAEAAVARDRVNPPIEKNSGRYNAFED